MHDCPEMKLKIHEFRYGGFLFSWCFSKDCTRGLYEIDINDCNML